MCPDGSSLVFLINHTWVSGVQTLPCSSHIIHNSAFPLPRMVDLGAKRGCWDSVRASCAVSEEMLPNSLLVPFFSRNLS